MQIVEDEAWTEQGIPYTPDRVVEVWRDIRKNQQIKLKCQVSIVHGCQCFYANRGLGECSDEVDLDRLIPESRGGKYTVENCVIACSFHNRASGDRNIEEFLSSGAGAGGVVANAGVAASPAK